MSAPLQYLSGKNGATITKPKDITDEHAEAFAGNPILFQPIKEQGVKVRLDFSADNTEFYKALFRLRDLRQLILKAKYCAPDVMGSTAICWNIF